LSHYPPSRPAIEGFWSRLTIPVNRDHRSCPSGIKTGHQCNVNVTLNR